MAKRNMIKDLSACTEDIFELPVYVTAVGPELLHNEHGQAYINISITDGVENLVIPCKDSRIDEIKKRFENGVCIISLPTRGSLRIVRIGPCNDFTAKDFGINAQPDGDNASGDDPGRPMISGMEAYKGQNYRLPAMVTGVVQKKSRNGEPYCSVTFTDGESSFSANWWNMDAENVSGQYLDKVAYITVRVEEFPKIMGMEPCGDYPVSAFIRTAPVAPEAMYEEITGILGGLESTMAPVALKLYEDNKDCLLRWAGALKLHHNVYGGLLYHVYRMVKAAQKMGETYPALDTELLIIGAALHDIGKLRELNTSETGSTEFMPDGNLEGHTVLGIEMIMETVMEMQDKPDMEEYRLVRHMVASHHGKTEYGAAVEPATPEAMVLHHLDMIDSRMDMFEGTMKDMQEGMVSGSVYGLGGTHVYKHVAFTKPSQETDPAEKA